MPLALIPSPADQKVEQEWVSAEPLLSHEECKNVRTELEALREHWIQRHPSRPFFTVGAANYFDITFNPMLPYYRMAARWNPLLWEHFGWLYNGLKSHLEARLGAPVVYREGLALPGFHVFLSDPGFEEPVDMTHREWFLAKGKKDVVGNAIHCDTAHLVVNWGESKPELDNPISVTLPIALPASGAGLNYWSFGKERTSEVPPAELRGLLLSEPRDYFPYGLGDVVIHDGLRYHQMAAMTHMAPDEARITLQGHGVMVDGVWQLFW